MPAWIGILIAAASLLVTAGNLIGVAVLRYSLSQNQLENANLKNELIDTIETRDKAVLERVDRMASNFGESYTALREHINLVTNELRTQLHKSELHNRDHFVRHGEVEDMQKGVKELWDTINKLRGEIQHLRQDRSERHER